jgi:hypothetical protein
MMQESRKTVEWICVEVSFSFASRGGEELERISTRSTLLLGVRCLAEPTQSLITRLIPRRPVAFPFRRFLFARGR